jgi:hypothetical protein
VKALSDIRPWLRLKAEEADIALEWWGQRPVPRRGSAGRYLPFSTEERDLDAAGEARLKAAKAGAPVTATIGFGQCPIRRPSAPTQPAGRSRGVE